MARQGVIYDFATSSNSGEVVLALNRGARVAYVLSQHLSSALIVVGLAGIVLTFGPIVSSEINYRLSKIFVSPKTVEEIHLESQLVVQAQEEQEKEVTRLLAYDLGLANSYFALYIPKINAKAPITDNVDPANQKQYMAALKNGVAHAAGSVFPGMSGATYLFAHSTDAPWNIAQYNAVFYLLRELEVQTQDTRGDEIYVFFLDKLYKYRVTQKHVVGARDLAWFTEAKVGPERLILQTCWPPGTTIKRLIIIAERFE